MDLELFRTAPSGQLVPITGSLPNGQVWDHAAFLPAPLGPESPELSSNAYRRVADARASLAALDATATRLPNPGLFRTATLRVEAQSTAALEGTYEPLRRVLAADPDDAEDASMREVLNYVLVAETAFAWAAEGRRLTVAALSELQAALVAGTPAERQYSGQLRPVQVVIGRRDSAPLTEIPIKAARFVPPPPGPDLDSRMRDLMTWIATDHRARIDPVVAAAMAHYLFETLHPFHDGNGRLGRLLVVLQLHSSGVLQEPTLSVSPWFEARRAAYYDALLNVSSRGDWSGWVEFFALGLHESALETHRRMLALVDAQAELRQTLDERRSKSPNARLLVDFAVANPSFTIADVAARLQMTHPGAGKLVDSLVGYGILAPYGERTYNRRFHAPRVLGVLLGE